MHYGIIDRQRPYQYGLPSADELGQLSSEHTDAQLASMFGCSEVTIRSHRHSANIFRTRGRRRYSLNERFFENIDTEHKAYALGFIAADGAIPDNGRSVRIELHAKDEHILRDIRDAMGSNASIKHRPIIDGFPNRGPYKLIYFSSKKLVSDLAKQGITPRKSLTLQYRTLDPKIERHYIRGLLDGDGCVRKKSFYFCGTEHIVDGLFSSIVHHTGIHLTKSHDERHLFRLTGCKRSKSVLSWLFEDATIFLHRKRQIFVDHWS